MALDQVIHKYTLPHSEKEINFLQVSRQMEIGDWKLFYILGLNMEPLVFGELMTEFAEQLKDGNHNVSQDADKRVTRI